MIKKELYTPFIASSRSCSSAFLSKEGGDVRLLVLVEIQLRSMVEEGLDCELGQDANPCLGSKCHL